mgnify:CR=1 FL=1
MNTLDQIYIAQRDAGESAWIANLEKMGLLTKEPTPLELMTQERDKLNTEIARYERLNESFNHIISNHCIAMQAAVIETEINGSEEGMSWIVNTLVGPGLYPDIEDAKSIGGAQAWFDRESAIEAARVAATKTTEGATA